MRRDAPRSRRACAAIERRSKGDRRLCGPQGFKPQLPLWDVVEVGPYRIGVLGLLTSERGIFRKDKMRGLAIEPVGAMAERLAALLRSEHGATRRLGVTRITMEENHNGGGQCQQGVEDVKGEQVVSLCVRLLACDVRLTPKHNPGPEIARQHSDSQTRNTGSQGRRAKTLSRALDADSEAAPVHAV